MAHEYPVSMEWAGGRDGKGQLTLKEAGALDVSVDTALGGLGIGTNPEELLSAAVASCYSITYGIIAANRKLPVTNVTAETTVLVEGQSPNLKITKVSVRPRIQATAPTPEQLKTLEQIAEMAEKYCLVSNALRGSVEIAVVDPQIESV